MTEILALDGFDFEALDFADDIGELDDLDFSDGSVFDNGARVLLAPELDDLDASDDMIPQRLSVPRRLDVRVDIEPGTEGTRVPGRVDPDATQVIAVPQVIPFARRGGQHRAQPASAARSRLLISAMAAGAAAAAAHTSTNQADTPRATAVLTAHASSLTGGAGIGTSRGAQVIAVQPAENAVVHNEELAKGVAFANARAQREARLQQPLYVLPARGIFTSNFGYRWGVLHAGIDIANSIGTPIVAVSDGVVVEAGPAAGYGALVKLRHADGTVTLYGHVNSTLVGAGQRVMAGDQIATMGNRGNSTGPHLHFEVLRGGSQRIDPLPWLAERGLKLSNYTG